MTNIHRCSSPPQSHTNGIAIIAFVFYLSYLGTSWSPAADWPQWRGPNRDAISAEQGLLRAWTGNGPATVWHASGLGEGYASVAVSDGKLFTIGKLGEDVFCFSLDLQTGKQIWAAKIGVSTRIPMSMPTCDAGRVYALDPDGDLVCLDSGTGEIVWKKSYTDDFDGQMMSGRGYGESPLVDGEKLICTPGGTETTIVALDKHCGELLWKSELPNIGPAGRDGAGFSSVVVTKTAEIRQYVQLVGRGVIGVAASDGRFLWGYNGLAVETANIPTPVVRGDLVFAANGYGAGSVLLRLVPVGNENIEAQEVYRLRGTQFQNHHGGIILVGDYIYGGHGSNNGLPTCLELATGRIVWKRRGPGVGSAAVVYGDGHLYFRYQNGTMALIEATPVAYDLKGTFKIPGAGGDSWAHPVIAHGKLYLREKDQLWAYDVQGSESVATHAPSPADDAVAIAMGELDVATELLGDRQALNGRSDKQRLYQYLYKQNGNVEAAARTRIFTLTRQHIRSDGALDATLLEQLSQVKESFVLSLAGTAVSDRSLQQVGKLVQLVGLDLEFCSKITDNGLAHLASAPRLGSLSLTGTQVSDYGMDHVAGMKHLRVLDLEVCDGITDAACERLATMLQLRALVLKKTGFEKNCITDDGLRQLRRLSQLELLNLYGNHISDEGIAHLRGMKRLRELDLSLLAITDEGIAHLSTLTNLKRLELVYSTGFSGPMLTNQGLETLERLSNLESVSLTGSKITDEGTKHLMSLSKLLNLTVINTGLTDAGIKQLQAALPNCTIER